MLYTTLLNCGHRKIGAVQHGENETLVCYHCGPKGLGSMRRVIAVEEMVRPAVEKAEVKARKNG